jgi:hypothetical protein
MRAGRKNATPGQSEKDQEVSSPKSKDNQRQRAGRSPLPFFIFSKAIVPEIRP